MPAGRPILADFDYDLPVSAIAQTPVEPRDAARLLVDRGPAHEPAHHVVADLPDLLRPGDLVVVNDTRVLPARLALRRASGGAAEALLLERLPDGTWDALVRPGRRLKRGERLDAAAGHQLELVSPVPGGAHEGYPGIPGAGGRAAAIPVTRRVRLLDRDGRSAPDEATEMAWLGAIGEVPLPPYITEPLGDPERYQTVFAARPASAAAPTAGLHLTPAVLARLGERGIGLARVELVVGVDTFRPVKTDDPADHVMHREAYHVTPEVLERCHATRAAGGRVVAIGTTSVRALESAVRFGATGRTGLFIRRPFDWAVVDVLMTNFHLPRTTLLMMIDAFVGTRWRDLYAAALADGYRFLSFGDAMLVERAA